MTDPRQAENIRRRAVWRQLNNTSGPKEQTRPGDEAWLRSEWRERE